MRALSRSPYSLKGGQGISVIKNSGFRQYFGGPKTTDYGDCVYRTFEGREAIDRVDLLSVLLYGDGLYCLVQSNFQVLARATRGAVPRASIDPRPAAER